MFEDGKVWLDSERIKFRQLRGSVQEAIWLTNFQQKEQIFTYGVAVYESFKASILIILWYLFH